MTPRLLERYRDEIIPKLKTEFSYQNAHQVPGMAKVVVNVGLGEATQNPKLLEKAMEELAQITGQKSCMRRATKSVSNFKLREGQAIGAMVTLRGARMWEFLDRLINVALPRVRDFKGVSPKAFDGRGNYTLGVKRADHLPRGRLRLGGEDHRDERHRSVTTANTDAEAKALLGPPRNAVPHLLVRTLNAMMTDPDRRHAGPHPQRGAGRGIASTTLPRLQGEGSPLPRSSPQEGFVGRRVEFEEDGPASRRSVSEACATATTAGTMIDGLQAA